MNRRKVLLALAAGAAVAAFARKARGTDCASPDDALAQAVMQDAATALPGLYAQSPVTLVGDTLHNRPEGMLFFFGLKNVEYLRNAGKKSVFIEAPPAFQKLLDGTARGLLGPNELAASFVIPWLQPKENMAVIRNMWRGLRMMSMSGIAVHAVDQMQAQLTPEEIKDFTDHMVGRKLLSDQQLVDIMQKRSDDTLLHQAILEKAGDRPYVVLHGAHHFESRAKSLRGLLDARNPVHINIYADRAAYADPRACGYTAPYAHIVAENKIFAAAVPRAQVLKSLLPA